MKNKNLFLTSFILILGIVFLLGSSYSLITNMEVTENGYSFTVADFKATFLDNKQIAINSIPISDNDALKNSKEYVFNVSNNSEHDVNYRLDIMENSTFTMGNVIKYSYSLNGSGFNSVNLLSDNYTIAQNKVLKKGEVDTYKIKMWLSIDADETYMNKKFSATISLLATSNEYKYATNVIETLANNSQDGVVKVNNEFRYLNMNSLNYVWFNCQDNYTRGDNYCEKWRIIGSFDNNWQKSNSNYKMLKIMDNKVYSNVAFNNDDKNGDYNDSYIETYANGYYYDKLNTHAKDLIIKAKWNIGKTDTTVYNASYEKEQTKSYYNNIGLLNVSDYLYLGNNSWFQLTDIQTLNKNNDDINVITSNGIISRDSKEELGFVPVVYLKPDVSIVSGNGSFDSPYELVVKYPMNYGIID